MPKEFSIIEKYFKKQIKNVPLGIGDDGALIEKDKQTYYVISQDTLNEGTHFFANHNPRRLGWKTLAVNVSDICAMGGTPRYVLLSLSIRDTNDSWLNEFSKGFFACAKKYGVQLIGGDTSKGKKSFSITIVGEVKKNDVLRRDSAKFDEDIWVTGEIGLAALGLSQQMKKISLRGQVHTKALSAIEMPKPIKVNMQEIAPFFSSAIDISDGLIPDLQHILNQSKVGATINCIDIPVPSWIKKNNAYDLALYGGEDYQLILTSQKRNREKIIKIAKKNNLKLSVIGTTTKSKHLELFDADNNLVKKLKKGFTHFG